MWAGDCSANKTGDDLADDGSMNGFCPASSAGSQGSQPGSQGSEASNSSEQEWGCDVLVGSDGVCHEGGGDVTTWDEGQCNGVCPKLQKMGWCCASYGNSCTIKTEGACMNTEVHDWYDAKGQENCNNVCAD